MSKTFWAIIAGIVIVFGGLILFNGHKAGAPSATSAAATNHVEGQSPAGVTLVEYGDYQCPFCGEFYPTVKAVAAKYNTQVVFQFRNLPLLQVHQNAFAAARAAEAASLQGKFWGMFDALYGNQTAWAETSNAETYFNQYASSLGLNMTKFKQDYASDAVNNTINADISAFLKTGQQESTPTFFIDGKKVQPATNTVAAFSKFIDPELASKTKK